LVLNDTLVESVVSAALGLVLTEWKVGDEKNATAKVRERGDNERKSQLQRFRQADNVAMLPRVQHESERWYPFAGASDILARSD
jgi:hypothetical protein